jgi:hypothetical protein
MDEGLRAQLIREIQEYLVRKIAGRLGLSTADLVETKVRAREDFLREDL